mgnify:CR=1 FL=1
MAKIKCRFHNMPILATFLLLTATFVILAMSVIEVERTLLQNGQYAIAFRYSDIVEGFNGIKVWGANSTYTLSTQDSRLMQLYELLLWLLPPVTYFICLFTASIIFYRSKIKIPLSLLSSSAAKIAEKDLDFTIQYSKNDEMGQLCIAFEKMRSALEINNREMWRQMEDRKRLNAAFSHDLRTPLTVLEGHLGILQKYTPAGKLTTDDLKEVYISMAGQIDRLKIYVSAMNDLQRLEDIEIKKQLVQTVDFIMQLKDTAKIICGSKQLTFSNEIMTETIYICPEIVIQVIENLLSNAIRYTKSSICIKCYTIDNNFIINVTDNGIGFNETVLKHATNPFYTTERKDSSGHFGLGLNICKILCERHNGTITLSNLPTGGASITVSFGMDE